MKHIRCGERYGHNGLCQTPSLKMARIVMILKVTNNIFDIAIQQAIQQRQYNCSTFVLTTAIFKNGGNKCHRSQVFVYLKLESPETYIGIPQLLLCMPYLLRYGDIEFGSHFEKWPSSRYAQFLKFPPSRILKPYVYITQINSQTSILPKCLRAYRAGPGL